MSSTSRRAFPGVLILMTLAIAVIGCGDTKPMIDLPDDGGAGCRSCKSAGADCGVIDDGCGQQLYCGECAAPESCGGGGVPRVCGGDPSCVPAGDPCPGTSCGPGADSCGNPVDCGSCPTGPKPGMVEIPAGRFWMGCNRDVEGACLSEDEDPGHWVELSTYQIDQYEVTQANWNACVADSACQSFSLEQCGWNPAMRGNWPVVCVSWSAAQVYCTHQGKRLPTEAQWERAARGDHGATYPWGNGQPTCSRATIEYCSTSLDPKPVGTAAQGVSPFGAFDLSGNVAEWVADWHSTTYYAVSPLHDPRGPSVGTYKVTRGGYFVSSPTGARSATRTRLRPDETEYTTGFRCAL